MSPLIFHTLHTHFHVHLALTRRTNGQSLINFQRNTISYIADHCTKKWTSSSLKACYLRRFGETEYCWPGRDAVYIVRHSVPFLYSTDKGTTFLQNLVKFLPDHTASFYRRLHFLSSPWELLISPCFCTVICFHTVVTLITYVCIHVYVYVFMYYVCMYACMYLRMYVPNILLVIL